MKAYFICTVLSFKYVGLYTLFQRYYLKIMQALLMHLRNYQKYIPTTSANARNTKYTMTELEECICIRQLLRLKKLNSNKLHEDSNTSVLRVSHAVTEGSR